MTTTPIPATFPETDDELLGILKRERNARRSEPPGLFKKYLVLKRDGSPVSRDAQYLVLRLDTDAAAREAAITYAMGLIGQGKEEYARDIIRWVHILRAESGEAPPIHPNLKEMYEEAKREVLGE